MLNTGGRGKLNDGIPGQGRYRILRHSTAQDPFAGNAAALVIRSRSLPHFQHTSFRHSCPRGNAL